MPDVVVISGHPHPGSSTLQLALAVGKRFAASRGHPRFVTPLAAVADQYTTAITA